MKNTIISVMVVVLCGLSVPKAQAELITINITATVDIVEDSGNYLEGKIHIGDTITGSYTYESTTLDSNPLPNGGAYWHYTTPAGISLSVGGFEFRTNPDSVNFVIEITNDYPPNDDYFVSSNNNLTLSNGTTVTYVSWHLGDSTGTALSGDTLPVTAPLLSQWQSNNLDIHGGEKMDEFFISADVTSAQLVPEPSTLLLLSFGVIMLKIHKHS
jgi:hypothetical protein